MMSSEQFTLQFIEALRNVDVRATFKELINELVIEHTAELTRKITDLETEQFSQLEKINGLEEKLEDLKDENETLQIKLDDYEQYSRINSLRFNTKWPEKEGETISEIKLNIIKTVKTAGVPIDETDIDACHRVGKLAPNNRHPRGIIVKFVRRQTKYDILKFKKNLKDDNGDQVYAVEDLTKHRVQLAYECRLLKKNGRIKDTWIANGNVIVKHDNDSKTIVRSRSQIENIM